jgi:hypothetical protein
MLLRKPLLLACCTATWEVRGAGAAIGICLDAHLAGAEHGLTR